MVVIGIGATSAAQPDAICAAVSKAWPTPSNAELVLATRTDAPFEAAVRAAAKALGAGFTAVSLDALRQRSGDCATRSSPSLARFGVASIAEAAALAGAGPGSRLAVSRIICGRVTAAVAVSGIGAGNAPCERAMGDAAP